MKKLFLISISFILIHCGKDPEVKIDSVPPAVDTESALPPVNTESAPPAVDTESDLPPVNTESALPPVESLPLADTEPDSSPLFPDTPRAPAPAPPSQAPTKLRPEPIDNPQAIPGSYYGLSDQGNAYTLWIDDISSGQDTKALSFLIFQQNQIQAVRTKLESSSIPQALFLKSCNYMVQNLGGIKTTRREVEKSFNELWDGVGALSITYENSFGNTIQANREYPLDEVHKWGEQDYRLIKATFTQSNRLFVKLRKSFWSKDPIIHFDKQAGVTTYDLVKAYLKSRYTVINFFGLPHVGRKARPGCHLLERQIN